MAYVIGEDGTIERAFDLYALDRRIGAIVADAKDPFGIDSVPTHCEAAYHALKYGQYSMAAQLAKRLARSKDDAVKTCAAKIVEATATVRAQWLERMQALAADGQAGRLHAEIAAYIASFPVGTNKGELKRLQSKAKKTAQGKLEWRAATTFERAVNALRGNGRNGDQLLKAIADQLSDTYYGRLAARIVQATRPRR